MSEQSARVLICASCGQDLRETYYGVFGRLACERCHSTAQLAWEQASVIGPVLRAGAYGILAAAAGAVVWYAVAAATGYEVLPLSMAVGGLIGWAVRKGSQSRGGWVYQAAAIVLTYAAIASTYMPAVARALTVRLETRANMVAEARPASDAGTASAPRGGPVRVGATRFWLAVATIAFQFPLLAESQSVKGIMIILAALFVAFAVNHRPRPALEGPYPVNVPEP